MNAQFQNHIPRNDSSFRILLRAALCAGMVLVAGCPRPSDDLSQEGPKGPVTLGPLKQDDIDRYLVVMGAMAKLNAGELSQGKQESAEPGQVLQGLLPVLQEQGLTPKLFEQISVRVDLCLQLSATGADGQIESIGDNAPDELKAQIKAALEQAKAAREAEVRRVREMLKKRQYVYEASEAELDLVRENMPRIMELLMPRSGGPKPDATPTNEQGTGAEEQKVVR